MPSANPSGPIGAKLQKLGLISEKTTDHNMFHYGVRDHPTVIVLKCQKTDVIFPQSFPVPVDKTKHTRLSIEDAALTSDNIRREQELIGFVRDKRWADVGAGTGGLLQRLHDKATYAVGIEPQDKLRTNYPCDARETILQLEDNYYNTITMIHSLEHIFDFDNFLKQIYKKLVPGGNLIIEVPHARDFILSSCLAARKALLWSEHYVLHTVESLGKLLEITGFSYLPIRYVQRYPLSNHLYWALNGEPDGHKVWGAIDNDALKQAYTFALTNLRMTDTLICYAYKPFIT